MLMFHGGKKMMFAFQIDAINLDRQRTKLNTNY